MRSIKFVILCFFILQLCTAYKIVFYLNAAAKTHLDYASILIDSLVEKGHTVDLIIARMNPMVSGNGTTKTKRIIEFSMPKDKDWVKKSHLAHPFNDWFWSVFGTIPWWFSARYYFNYAATSLCKVGMQSGEPLRFLQEGNYEIGLTSDYDLCGAMLLYKAGIPSIGSYLPTTILPMEIESHGIPMPVGAYQDLMFPYDLDLSNNIFHRIYNSIHGTLRTYVERPFLMNMQTSLAKSFYGPDFPEAHTIANNYDIVFTNTVDMLESSRPTIHKIKNIGGIAIKPPKKLEANFETIVSNPKYKGIVLFTFGTQIQTAHMPQEIRIALAKAFSKFPDYLFLWKYDPMPDDAIVFNGIANIQTFKWLPQRDLLAHDRIVGFISHMGLNSYTEAAYSGVPILAIPIFTDQFHNTRNAVSRGFAFKVCKNNITEESIKFGLREILFQPTYRENAKRVSQALKSRPESSKDVFVKWVEYAAANPELHKYLNLPSNDMPAIQYYCLDIFFYAILLSLTILYLLYRFVRYLFCKNRSQNKPKAKLQ